MEKDPKYLRAKKKVENLKAFYIHLSVFILVNIFIFVINLMSYDGIWWFVYPLGGWGIGLVAHGLTVLAESKLGSDWEERKIKEYMEKDNRED